MPIAPQPSHAHGHIIEILHGGYWADTPEGIGLVPAGQALWIPPRIRHEIHSRAAVGARMLFVDESLAGRLHPHCGTVEVSPLLDRLIARALDHGDDYGSGSPVERLALVILDEPAAMRPTTLLIPLSREPRLAGAMARLVHSPAAGTELAALACDVGASPRTLARLFRSETGMSFTQWKTRVCLVESIGRLARGEPVTRVAIELGYASASGFTSMFRRNMGVPPGRDCANGAGRPGGLGDGVVSAAGAMP